MKKSRLIGLILAVVSMVVSGGISSAATIDVNVNSFLYSPDPITVNVGDTVRWTNGSVMTHTVTSGANCTADGQWDSGSLRPGGTFSRVFDTPGSFAYFCAIATHCASLGMEGTVIVQSATAQPRPDIKANGSDTAVVVSAASTVTIAVTLDAGSLAGQNADWWVAASTPFGWFYYDALQGQFQSVDNSPQLILPSLQTPLLTVAAPLTVLSSPLPPGSYTFYFAVDGIADGVLDATLLDSVQVTVQ